ncbi:DUF5008 domain-containing protein [Pedobacter gandavensis]|uniref:DUF5008 domain-containing protein n=1 Tax=Pedobacter gandavensis TaxID=2679963 RepID=UPI00292D8B02|nr:DUF5008 domain-containing protein [Pedobacter gandavensis]
MISINTLNIRVNLMSLLLLLLVLVQVSCKKKEGFVVDPYGGGKLALGVKFIGDEASPSSGSTGEEVTFKINGLAKYQGKFDFFINETKAEIVTVSDSTVTVKVPENASSGGTTVLLEGQSFFGPKFSVDGKVAVDASFKAVNGTNGPIYDLYKTPSGDYMMVGSFNNFENQAATVPINGIVLISRDGAFQNSLKAGKGSDGSILSINRLNSGKYIVGGFINSYNKRLGMNGITRLNVDGSLDSTRIRVVNVKPDIPGMGFDTVATFNGGVFGVAYRTFVRDNKITVLGSFTHYVKYFYERSTRDFKVTDITGMNQMVRMTEDGTMDSTFNYNPDTKQGYAGGNGSIYDGFMQADGKIVAIGSFTTFNGVPANHIVRINTDGSVDKTFNTGSGADGPVISITYNAVTGKIMLAGAFKNFNGKPREGVVMLNTNGTVDDLFQFNQLVGGVPNFAHQLNNGKVLVSGGFNSYHGVIRQGFMILGQNGTLAAGYNNTGAFEGQVLKVVETTSALGNPAVILVGAFNKFNNTRVGNIVRVELKQ